MAQKGVVSRGNKLLKKDRVSYILSNPFYHGFFRYGGETFIGKHSPIISKKLFDNVQQTLEKRSSKGWRKERIPKAFTGLLRCGECGMMITSEIQKSHTYYRCSKKSQIYKCLEPYVRQEDLDSQLSSMIQKVSLRQDWAREMLIKLKDDEKETSQSCLAFVLENRGKISSLKQKLQFLLDSYLDQVLERDTYLQRKAEIMGEIKTLEEQNIRFEQKQNAWLESMRQWVTQAAGAGAR